MMKMLRIGGLLCLAIVLFAGCAPSTQPSQAPQPQAIAGVSYSAVGGFDDVATVVADAENPVVIRWVYRGLPGLIDGSFLGLERAEVDALISPLVPRFPVPEVGFVASRDVTTRYRLSGVDAPAGFEAELTDVFLSRDVDRIEDNIVYFRDSLDLLFSTTIPEGAEPGVYTLGARVEHEDGLSAVLPLQVEIVSQETDVAATP